VGKSVANKAGFEPLFKPRCHEGPCGATPDNYNVPKWSVTESLRSLCRDRMGQHTASVRERRERRTRRTRKRGTEEEKRNKS